MLATSTLNKSFPSSFAFLVVLALLSPCQLWAQNSLKFERVIGETSAAGKVHFYITDDVALDSEGNIYVADRGKNLVQKLSKEGQFLMSFGSYGQGEGQFTSPSAIDVDAAGNIYVADDAENRVQKFSPNGQFLFSIGSKGSANGQFNAPADIALDSEGNIYVVEKNNARIQKFSAEGQFLMAFGSKGSANGEFDSPLGIAINGEGKIYIADTGNNRIQILNSEGDYLNQLVNDQLTKPAGITIDGEGNLFIADTKVIKLKSNGDFLLSFDGNQFDAKRIWRPSGIATDSDGNVFVTVPYQNVVEKFSNDGVSLARLVSSPGFFNFPRGVALDAHGNVYVADNFNDRIQKFSPDGKFLLSFGTTGTGDGQFVSPTGIAIDTKNQVYVIDFYTRRIQKFNSTGDFILSYINEEEVPAGLQPTTHFAIATDALDNVYVVDGGSKLYKYDSNGGFLMKFGEHGNLKGQWWLSYGIAVDKEGNIYVSDGAIACCDESWDMNGIKKFDQKGKFLNSFGSNGTGEGQLRSPRGIAVDQQGVIYVAEISNNRVQLFNAAGEHLQIIGEKGDREDQFNNPIGVAVDAGGNNLYVANYTSGLVQKFSTGTATALEDYQTKKNKLIAYPNPVHDGKVQFVTSKQIKRIDVLSVTGKVVFTKNVLGEQVQLNLQHLQPGLYLVRATDIAGSTETVKLQKK